MEHGHVFTEHKGATWFMYQMRGAESGHVLVAVSRIKIEQSLKCDIMATLTVHTSKNLLCSDTTFQATAGIIDLFLGRGHLI